MNKQESLRLSFNIESKRLRLTRSLREETSPPQGEQRPFNPIEPTIIGHWVEVRGDDGETVYRRFLHNVLPLNYLVETLDTTLKNYRRSKPETTFEVLIPFPRGNCELTIYEQSLPGPEEKKTRRREHIKLHLDECEQLVTEPA